MVVDDVGESMQTQLYDLKFVHSHGHASQTRDDGAQDGISTVVSLRHTHTGMRVDLLFRQRRLEAAFYELRAESIIAASLRVLRKRRAIPGLPDEIVLQILQAAADILLVDTPRHEWWTIPPAYSAFFDAASLVCRKWNRLAWTFRTTLYCTTVEYFQILGKGGAASTAWLDRCKSLHIISMLGRPPTSDLKLPKCVPACLSTSALNITSLSFDIALWEAPAFSLFFSSFVSRVYRLKVQGYGSRYGYVLTRSQVAVIRSNLNLKELALCSLHLELDDDYAKKPFLCETVILDDVQTCTYTRVQFAAVFPKASRLILERSVCGAAIGYDSIQLTKTSDSLRHLEVYWDVHFPLHFKILKNKPGILRSPNLRTLCLRVRSHSNYSQYHDVSILPLVIPGYDMPSLTTLDIRVSEDGYWPSSLVELCKQLQDPTFLPRLETLPDLRVLPSYKRCDYDKLDAYAERSTISLALAAMKRRDIQISQEDLDKSIWRYATIGLESQ